MSGTTLARRELTPENWNMIAAVAPAMHLSRFFGVSNTEQAAAIMLKGHELGLGLAASFEFVQVIQGKPGISPRGALAIIHASGAAEVEITETMDAQGAHVGHTVRMKRRDSGFEYKTSFTLTDAQRAGLVKPGSGWANYPARMTLWRAVGFCADVVVPDVLCGMKTTDRLGADLTVDGDTIEGAWTVQSAPTTTEQAIEVRAVTVTLDDLLTLYGAEQVLVANEGRIPGTNEEIAALAAKMAGGVA